MILLSPQPSSMEKMTQRAFERAKVYPDEAENSIKQASLRGPVTNIYGAAYKAPPTATPDFVGWIMPRGHARRASAESTRVATVSYVSVHHTMA